MIPNPRARLTDPITSHEAAEAVDVPRSQAVVLRWARKLGDFTDLQLEQEYRHWRNPAIDPDLSGSRLRSARHELAEKQLIELVGYTSPPRGRRRCIWRATTGTESRPGGAPETPEVAA